MPLSIGALGSQMKTHLEVCKNCYNLRTYATDARKLFCLLYYELPLDALANEDNSEVINVRSVVDEDFQNTPDCPYALEHAVLDT